MTLTELKYIVAVAQTHHFGKAAELCNISQPSLSVAVRKLEKELDVALFERRSLDVVPTPIGERIIDQARTVINESQRVYELAQVDKDPLSGPLRLGVIYTISPFLLPELVRKSVQRCPQMPLVITENYTANLLPMLKNGEIDAAILALPINESGLMACDLYDEDFMIVIPKHHHWNKRPSILPKELAMENMLILAQGNCFRDQVLEVCPETMRVGSDVVAADALHKTFEGSSLSTIRHMVASGLGVSVFPASAHNYDINDSLVKYIPFQDPVPSRRVAIVWRKTFPRFAAIEELVRTCHEVRLEGIHHLSKPAYPLGT